MSHARGLGCTFRCDCAYATINPSKKVADVLDYIDIMNYLDRFVLSLLTQVTVMLNIGTGTPSVLLGSEALKRIWDLDQMSFR